MGHLEQINSILQKMITENTHKLVTVISFDRIERGFSLIGDFFDNNDNFITYASYNNAFELRSLIFDWQEKTIYSPWNKATFTTNLFRILYLS